MEKSLASRQHSLIFAPRNLRKKSISGGTSSSAMVTYTVSKNDHSLFGYIDIDGIIYEIFLIPANHCHVLSLCMSIIVALRLFIVHMNWQPV